MCRIGLLVVSGGGINKDGTRLAQQEPSGTSRAKERDMEAKAVGGQGYIRCERTPLEQRTHSLTHWNDTWYLNFLNTH